RARRGREDPARRSLLSPADLAEQRLHANQPADVQPRHGAAGARDLPDLLHAAQLPGRLRAVSRTDLADDPERPHVPTRGGDRVRASPQGRAEAEGSGDGLDLGLGRLPRSHVHGSGGVGGARSGERAPPGRRARRRAGGRVRADVPLPARRCRRRYLPPQRQGGPERLPAVSRFLLSADAAPALRLWALDEALRGFVVLRPAPVGPPRRRARPERLRSRRAAHEKSPARDPGGLALRLEHALPRLALGREDVLPRDPPPLRLVRGGLLTSPPLEVLPERPPPRPRHRHTPLPGRGDSAAAGPPRSLRDRGPPAAARPFRSRARRRAPPQRILPAHGPRRLPLQRPRRARHPV